MTELQPQKIEVSVVMPCLNEAETLATCIRKALQFFDHHQVAGEVIVADNGSTDGSDRIALDQGARLVRVEEKGYGGALLGGCNAARGTYIIMGDADDSYDFTSLMPFVEKLRLGFDLVMGNRFQGGIFPGAMPLLHKYLGNPVLSGIARLFFRIESVGDFHCGLRGFRKDAFLRMKLRTTGMEFATEMVVKAASNRMRIAEVPTTLSPDGRSRPPHLRTWRDGWRHLRFMLLYSPDWLFLWPGVALVILGMASMIWIIGGVRTVGPISLDVHTLVYAIAAIVIGYQAALFSVFSKVFAATEGLIPEDPRLTRLLKSLKLEAGVVIGLVLILFGLGASVVAVIEWKRRAFGEFDPVQGLRTVIPAVLALILGAQTILSSFFLSVLQLRRRRTVEP
jgi:glycosyltransferase involved in cell wall biosynthesis